MDNEERDSALIEEMPASIESVKNGNLANILSVETVRLSEYPNDDNCPPNSIDYEKKGY